MAQLNEFVKYSRGIFLQTKNLLIIIVNKASHHVCNEIAVKRLFKDQLVDFAKRQTRFILLVRQKTCGRAIPPMYRYDEEKRQL